jgi:hypothetical protein
MNNRRNFPFGNNNFFDRMGAFNNMSNDNLNRQYTNTYPGYESYSMSNTGGTDIGAGTGMRTGSGKSTSIKKTTQYM